MYELSRRERVLKNIPLNKRPIVLRIHVELSTNNCVHRYGKKLITCDCNGWCLSERSQVLLMAGLAKIHYKEIDLSFL